MSIPTGHPREQEAEQLQATTRRPAGNRARARPGRYGCGLSRRLRLHIPRASTVLNRLLSLLGLRSGTDSPGSTFVPVYDDLQFDTTGFTLGEDSPEHRAWLAPDGSFVFLTIQGPT